MINEALAKKFFADRDPIGGHIRPWLRSERCRGCT